MRTEGRGGWGTYGPDVLSAGWRRPIVIPNVPVEVGMVVECAASGWCGAVVTWAKEGVQLEDRRGARRWFPMSTAAFLLDGRPITLVRPTPAAGREATYGLWLGGDRRGSRKGRARVADLGRGRS